jgi:WD40 repeat protein
MRMALFAVLILAALALTLPAQAAWSTPVEVTAINSTTQDYYPQISGDNKTLRVSSSRTGGVGGWDVFYATRAHAHAPWGPVQVEPGAINSTSNDLSPHVLSSELIAYFASLRPGTGGTDIWQVSRTASSQPWANAIEITTVNTTSSEYGVSVTDDELLMLLTSGNDLVASERTSLTQPWPTPIKVAELNIGTSHRDTRVSGDGLTVFFASTGATPSVGGYDIYMATRTFRTDRWGTPVHVATINSTATDRVPSLSSDGRQLFFSSSRTGGTGGQDVYVSMFTGLSYQNLPQVGSPLYLHLTYAARPGDNYQIGLSFTNNVGIAIPNVGTIPLDLDNLLIFVVQFPIPQIFTNFAGTLDVRGEATGQLNFPPSVGLVGIPFHAAAVLYNSKQGLTHITNGLKLGIHR